MLKGLIAILTADAGVQDLVGQNEEATKYKVYPVVAPSGEKAPYITASLAGGARSGKDCGRQFNFVVVSVATSYDDVDALDNAVIDAFDSMTAGTYEDVYVAFVVEVSLSVDGFNLDHQLYTRQSTFLCQLG
jgi:hypothetical protein